MSALREAVMLQMRLRGFAPNTVAAYIHAMVDALSPRGAHPSGSARTEVSGFARAVTLAHERLAFRQGRGYP